MSPTSTCPEWLADFALWPSPASRPSRCTLHTGGRAACDHSVIPAHARGAAWVQQRRCEPQSRLARRSSHRTPCTAPSRRDPCAGPAALYSHPRQRDNVQLGRARGGRAVRRHHDGPAVGARHREPDPRRVTRIQVEPLLRYIMAYVLECSCTGLLSRDGSPHTPRTRTAIQTVTLPLLQPDELPAPAPRYTVSGPTESRTAQPADGRGHLRAAGAAAAGGGLPVRVGHQRQVQVRAGPVRHLGLRVSPSCPAARTLRCPQANPP